VHAFERPCADDLVRSDGLLRVELGDSVAGDLGHEALGGFVPIVVVIARVVAGHEPGRVASDGEDDRAVWTKEPAESPLSSVEAPRTADLLGVLGFVRPRPPRMPPSVSPGVIIGCLTPDE
jgi:hypothetical protein